MGERAGSWAGQGDKAAPADSRGTTGAWPLAGCKEQSPRPPVLPQGREEEEGRGRELSAGDRPGVTPGHGGPGPAAVQGWDGAGPLQLRRAGQPGSSLGTAGGWQQGRQQASPLSAAIFRCWREAEER